MQDGPLAVAGRPAMLSLLRRHCGRIEHLGEAIGSAECVHGVIGPGKAVCCSARGAGANRPPGRVQCGLGPNEGLYKRFPGPSILL